MFRRQSFDERGGAEALTIRANRRRGRFRHGAIRARRDRGWLRFGRGDRGDNDRRRGRHGLRLRHRGDDGSRGGSGCHNVGLANGRDRRADRHRLALGHQRIGENAAFSRLNFEADLVGFDFRDRIARFHLFADRFQPA